MKRHLLKNNNVFKDISRVRSLFYMCSARMNSKEINLTGNSYLLNIKHRGKQEQSKIGSPHIYLETVLDLDICCNPMYLLK